MTELSIVYVWSQCPLHVPRDYPFP